MFDEKVEEFDFYKDGSNERPDLGYNSNERPNLGHNSNERLSLGYNSNERLSLGYNSNERLSLGLSEEMNVMEDVLDFGEEICLDTSESKQGKNPPQQQQTQKQEKMEFGEREEKKGKRVKKEVKREGKRKSGNREEEEEEEEEGVEGGGSVWKTLNNNTFSLNGNIFQFQIKKEKQTFKSDQLSFQLPLLPLSSSLSYSSLLSPLNATSEYSLYSLNLSFHNQTSITTQISQLQTLLSSLHFSKNNNNLKTNTNNFKNNTNNLNQPLLLQQISSLFPPLQKTISQDFHTLTHVYDTCLLNPVEMERLDWLRQELRNEAAQVQIYFEEFQAISRNQTKFP